jgi:dienelactone hydrolase
MSQNLRTIEYRSGDARLTGYLAEPEGTGKAPGILVAHEAIGVNAHVKSRARRLAEHGYMAFALDLYGKVGLSLEEARSRSAELMRTPGLLLARARAGLEILMGEPRVDSHRLSAIGFCQGGSTILELARNQAPLRAVIGFHPGFQRPEGSLVDRISAKVLMMSGDADPVVSGKDRSAFAQEMREANADWQLHVFGGVGHSYTNPGIGEYGLPGFAYDPVADARSWRMTVSLLDEVFANAEPDQAAGSE